MANEYGAIEQLVNDVTSLDTARMTLRWALERLNSIEKEKADLKKNLTIAEETSKQLQLKDASLTDAYSSRSKTLEEKEDFYAKLEATMSLLGEGKLDIRQLLKKEAKLDSLRHNLENEYSDKLEELDRNQRAVIERWNARLLEVESQYAGRLAEAQKKYDGLRSELEGDYQGRLAALQVSFKSREKYLSERIGGLEDSVRRSEEKVEIRRRELEGEYLVKKREMEENYRKLRNMLEAGLEEKIRAMDSDHTAQISSLETSWQIERVRLLEEQRVREDQFSAAQARIKEVEDKLASQQEIHHSELLKMISEKETAFRAQLAGLETEKGAKEAMVRELRARLEKEAGVREISLRERAKQLELEYARKLEYERENWRAERFRFENALKETSEKEKMWALEREKLSTAFSEVSAEANAMAEERMAVIRSQYEERKAALEKELEIKFADRLKTLEFEKTRAKELTAAAQDKIAEFKKGWEAEKNSLISAYGEKLIFMEQELIKAQSNGKEELAIAQENALREKERLLAEMEKRERSGDERVAYEQKRILELKEEHKAEKNSLISAYGEKLTFLEQELIRTQSDGKEELAIVQENALREKERLLEENAGYAKKLDAMWETIISEKREIEARAKKIVDAEKASADERFAAAREAQEAEKNSLISAYGEKLTFLEQELIRTQSDDKEELAIVQENALREKERLLEENAGYAKKLDAMWETIISEKREIEARAKKIVDAEKASADERFAAAREAQETEKNSLISAYGEKLTFLEQELIKAQNDSKEELAIAQENALREKERLLAEMETRERYAETADLKIQQLENEMMRRRQDSAKIMLEQIGAQEEKFKALLEEHRATQNASERDYAAKLEAGKREAASRIKQFEEMLSAKENLMAENDRFYAAKQAEMDKLRAEINLRLNRVNEEMFVQKQALGEKERELNDRHLKLEKDYAARMAEAEKLKAELTRTIIEYKNRPSDGHRP